jgi:hypothetical protein
MPISNRFMSSKNRHSQPFIIVLIVTVILLAASQLKTEYKVLGIHTKKVDLFDDILLKEKVKLVPLSRIIINDSIIAKDTTALAIRAKDPSNILDFQNDSSSGLAHFFGALNAIKKEKKKIRIAYFGDSMIEGDLISQDLRNQMQNAFGGSGVGFVPITSIVAGFRSSVQHQFGGWKTYTLLENIPSGHALGISGYTFVPEVTQNIDTMNLKAGSWVKYSAVKTQHLNKFHQAKLLYGKSNDDNYVIINNNTYKLSGTEPVNQIVIEDLNEAQSITARFQCKSPLDIFGFSIESDSGAFVDNFSFRGNSGFPLSKISQDIYAATNNCLNYDLIILEYGLNVVSPGMTDYSWYERGMLNVINHIKKSFPGASIMLISVGDKSYRKDGVYETDPSVPLLVSVQKKMSEQTGCAFWSLYDAMGGTGSMVKWVEGDTVLANKDYTHFNFKGAHKVGKLLYAKLMSEYRDYNKKND